MVALQQKCLPGAEPVEDRVADDPVLGGVAVLVAAARTGRPGGSSVSIP
ncbi:MAG: hypothetical protein ACR2N4_17995 [Jatrophihabitans sp.]